VPLHCYHLLLTGHSGADEQDVNFARRLRERNRSGLSCGMMELRFTYPMPLYLFLPALQRLLHYVTFWRIRYRLNSNGGVGAVLTKTSLGSRRRHSQPFGLRCLLNAAGAGIPRHTLCGCAARALRLRDAKHAGYLLLQRHATPAVSALRRL